MLTNKQKVSLATLILVGGILILLMLNSCNSAIEDSSKLKSEDYYENNNGNKRRWYSMDYSLTEKTIDSCEYIIIFGVDGRNIIHKANCNNHKLNH